MTQSSDLPKEILKDLITIERTLWGLAPSRQLHRASRVTFRPPPATSLRPISEDCDPRKPLNRGGPNEASVSTLSPLRPLRTGCYISPIAPVRYG